MHFCSIVLGIFFIPKEIQLICSAKHVCSEEKKDQENEGIKIDSKKSSYLM